MRKARTLHMYICILFYLPSTQQLAAFVPRLLYATDLSSGKYVCADVCPSIARAPGIKLIFKRSVSSSSSASGPLSPFSVCFVCNLRDAPKTMCKQLDVVAGQETSRQATDARGLARLRYRTTTTHFASYERRIFLTAVFSSVLRACAQCTTYMHMPSQCNPFCN